MRRFDVYLANLDPARGREKKKTRPVLIVSPDEMNRYCGTVIIAPMTTKGQNYPSRIKITFHKTKGQVALDQLRALDKRRLVRRLGKISRRKADRVLDVLHEIFAR